MNTFVKATYYPNERAAEYVTAEGKRLLRQGGSLCWLLNNCGNLVAPMKDGKPAPKKTRNYVGFARAGSAGHHFFMFSSYEAGRQEVKAWFKRRSQLSIQECIKTYAPSHENDTAKYIADLERMSGLLGSQVVGELSDTDLSKLVDALERKEGYHKDAHTRKERWVEATSISASNGSAPIAGLELQVQRGDKTETIKSNAQGQFPPIAHSGKSPVVVKAPKADGTWDKILELSESTASRFYQLVVDWFSTSATMQSDQAPSQAKQKRTPIQYRVQPGDSLSKIAKNFHTEVADLKRHNKLKNDTIYPEQVLWVYGAGAIDTGPKMPKPVVPKVAKPPAASAAKAPAPAAKPAAKPTKVPAADTAPVVRGQEGAGKPLAVFTAEPGRAPWMAYAIAEAKKQAGRTEDGKMIKTDAKTGVKAKVDNPAGAISTNYHAEIKSGLKSLEGSNNAWCAAFVTWCLQQAGYPTDKGLIATRASRFAFLNEKSAAGSNPLFHLIDEPVYGAIMLMKSKSHHVAFVYGRDGDEVIYLGGNQGDSISFLKFNPRIYKKHWFLVPTAYQEFAKKEKTGDLKEYKTINLNREFGTKAGEGTR